MQQESMPAVQPAQAVTLKSSLSASSLQPRAPVRVLDVGLQGRAPTRPLAPSSPLQHTRSRYVLQNDTLTWAHTHASVVFRTCWGLQNKKKKNKIH